MRRRKFAIGLLVGVLTSSSAIRAQVVRKVYRIGVLGLGTTPDMTGPNPVSPSVKALLGGMRDLGYVYGEQYVTEPRGSGGNPDRYPRWPRNSFDSKWTLSLPAGAPAWRR